MKCLASGWYKLPSILLAVPIATRLTSVKVKLPAFVKAAYVTKLPKSDLLHNISLTQGAKFVLVSFARSSAYSCQSEAVAAAAAAAIVGGD